jgi:4-hydroxy-tetrahydrodipicolinate synthase
MLNGIFPALPTPFSTDGLSVELDKIKPLCDSLIEDGVNGFFVCGTTGEGPCLSASEKISVLKTAVSAANGRAKILAQVGTADLPGTMEVVNQVRDIGVDAVSLLQPWFFTCDSEAQYNYISCIAESLNGFPMYLYNLPGPTGNNLEPATVERLRKNFSNIMGLKESGDPEMIERWAPYQSDNFEVVCGNDTQMMKTLRNGGKAVVASCANVLPKTFRGLFDAVQACDWEKAQGYQDNINKFVDVIIGPLAISYIKACLALKGLDAGSVRPPLRNLSEDEKKALVESLKSIEIK